MPQTYICYNDPTWTDQEPYGNKVARILKEDFKPFCERLGVTPDNFYVTNWCWVEKWVPVDNTGRYNVYPTSLEKGFLD